MAKSGNQRAIVNFLRKLANEIENRGIDMSDVVIGGRNELVEVDPTRGDDGKLWAQFRAISKHSFWMTWRFKK